jgi:hypothetical protein
MANPNDEDVLMSALQYILPGAPANTRLAAVGGPIIIQNAYALSQGRCPAVHIEVDRQRHRLDGGPNVWAAQIRFLVTYYDRFDQTRATIDQIRAAINTDIKVMMANVQANSSLAVGGVARATSVHQIELSPYQGELDDKTIPGLTLVKRQMKLWVSVLPYDV